jgi:hypothetical protein
MTEDETSEVSFRIRTDLKVLAQQVADLRGEGLSSLMRRVLITELARLGYLSEGAMKALGVRVESRPLEAV